MAGPVTHWDGDVPDAAVQEMLRSDSPVSRVSAVVTPQPSPVPGGEGGGVGVVPCGVLRHRDPAQSNINIFINSGVGGMKL